MANVARWVLLLALLLPAAWQSTAEAQPSTTAAGAPGSFSPYHAVPDFPFASESPMPSLPPPTAEEGHRDPPPAGVGKVIRRAGFEAFIHDDGGLIFDDTFLRTDLRVDSASGPRGSMSFDLSDILMRRFGGSSADPYVYEKMQLLEKTFDERVEIRRDHNARLMSRSLAQLPAYLRAIAESDRYSEADKRAIYFALWDECAEGGNEELRKGGAKARAIIEAFVRKRAHGREGGGYSEQELAYFNENRTSLDSFHP